MISIAQLQNKFGTVAFALVLVTGALGVSAQGFRQGARQSAAVQSAQVYAYGSHREQSFAVYPALGQQRVEAAPIIMMVHGGAWRMGDKAARGVVQNKVERWLPKGFIFVSVDYRLLPEADPLQQAQDVARAIAVVQERAQSWGGDPRKVILMGHSSGGHLVSLLTASPALAAAQGAKPWLGTVSLDSAALDIEAIMRAPHSRLYDEAFGAQTNRLWREASPAAVLTHNALPTLLVCSTQRQNDSCAQASAHEARIRAVGGRAEVAAFDLTHLQVNSLLGDDAAYTQRVEAFMASLDSSVAKRLR